MDLLLTWYRHIRYIWQKRHITVSDLNSVSNMKEEYMYRPASLSGFTVYRSLCE